jgi:hypothetical protein
VTILSPTIIKFNIKDLILIEAWVFVIFRINLNDFLGSYHATSVGAGSPNTFENSEKLKASPLQLHGKCKIINSSSNASKCYDFASYI